MLNMHSNVVDIVLGTQLHIHRCKMLFSTTTRSVRVPVLVQHIDGVAAGYQYWHIQTEEPCRK